MIFTDINAWYLENRNKLAIPLLIPIQKSVSKVWKMVEWVKHLQSKHEDLSLNSQYPHKKSGMVVVHTHEGLWGLVAEPASLAQMMTSRFSGIPSLKRIDSWVGKMALQVKGFATIPNYLRPESDPWNPHSGKRKLHPQLYYDLHTCAMTYVHTQVQSKCVFLFKKERLKKTPINLWSPYKCTHTHTN